MTIPQQYDEKSVLIVDDEPEHIQFVIDYFKARSLRVVLAETVSEALNKASIKKYRMYLIDLNIPLGQSIYIGALGSIYDLYLGLYVIRTVRGQGNDGARVLAYSAHYNQNLTAELDRLYTSYVPKGRVKELKAAIEQVLSFDPRADRSAQ